MQYPNYCINTTRYLQCKS